MDRTVLGGLYLPVGLTCLERLRCVLARTVLSPTCHTQLGSFCIRHQGTPTDHSGILSFPPPHTQSRSPDNSAFRASHASVTLPCGTCRGPFPGLPVSPLAPLHRAEGSLEPVCWISPALLRAPQRLPSRSPHPPASVGASSVCLHLFAPFSHPKTCVTPQICQLWSPWAGRSLCLGDPSPRSSPGCPSSPSFLP